MTNKGWQGIIFCPASLLPRTRQPAHPGSSSPQLLTLARFQGEMVCESPPECMAEASWDKTANNRCLRTLASILCSWENKSTAANIDNIDFRFQQENSRKKLKWNKLSPNISIPHFAYLLNGTSWNGPSLHLLMRTNPKVKPE